MTSTGGRPQRWKVKSQKTPINKRHECQYTHLHDANINADMDQQEKEPGGQMVVKVGEKVEDKHSLVFFICAWLGVGSQFP